MDCDYSNALFQTKVILKCRNGQNCVKKEETKCVFHIENLIFQYHGPELKFSVELCVDDTGLKSRDPKQ